MHNLTLFGRNFLTCTSARVSKQRAHSAVKAALLRYPNAYFEVKGTDVRLMVPQYTVNHPHRHPRGALCQLMLNS